jgi:hypothetical protein
MIAARAMFRALRRAVPHHRTRRIIEKQHAQYSAYRVVRAERHAVREIARDCRAQPRGKTAAPDVATSSRLQSCVRNTAAAVATVIARQDRAHALFNHHRYRLFSPLPSTRDDDAPVSMTQPASALITVASFTGYRRRVNVTLRTTPLDPQ